MDDARKKWTMLGIVSVLIIVTVLIIFKTYEKSYGIESLDSSETIWVKCTKCGVAYQMSKKDYLLYLREQSNPMVRSPMSCKECNADAVYIAEKCEKCGEVFFPGSGLNDFSDRCLGCGYSRIEVFKKKAPAK